MLVPGLPYRRVVESGLVMAVDELAALVDRWRVPTVPSAALGGPAHVTVLYPWVDAPVATSDLDRLEVQLADVRPMTLRFDRLERFPSGVLYLALDAPSEQRCRSLASLVGSAFPSCIPYNNEHPDPTPHLTIAMSDDDAVLDRITSEVGEALAPSLPYVATIPQLTVMTQAPDQRWHRTHHVPLLGDASTAPRGTQSH